MGWRGEAGQTLKGSKNQSHILSLVGARQGQGCRLHRAHNAVTWLILCQQGPGCMGPEMQAQ